jgi:aldehyde:ferredoxin oxidoreductase
MRYAETGINLEVDLTRGNIERVASDPEDTELYLGGLGTNAKIMWDRVPPEVEAFSPENLLIFGAGMLCGTPATGCNRTIVTTISPQTKLLAYSMMGGFWAPELKYAGYDKVILRGKSPKLVYLYINNDNVEIRDASHLQGKGAIETAELIRKELKEPKAQVAAIGMAGENRVFYASIEQGRSSASRGSAGAVMGDKSVKAIVVRGTKDIPVARPAEYMKLCGEVLDYIKWREGNPVKGVIPILSVLGSPQEMKIHDEKWHTENFSWGNARVRRKDFWTDEVAKEWEETLDNAWVRQISCFNCPMQCGATIKMPDMPADNEGRFFYLLDKIVRREGIGDILADGTYWAAKKIGKGADAYAHNTIKKHEQLPLKLGMLNPIYFLMFITGEKINITQIEGQFPQAPFPKREDREEFVKDWIQVPDDRFKQYFLDWEPRGENAMPFYPTVDMCCEIVDWQERMHYIDDAMGMCAGLSSFHLKAPYHIHNYPKFISAGAGIEMDEEKLTLAIKRYRTLVRAINTRRGMRRKDERPPKNHWKKRFPELEKELLDSYYKMKGWNNEGIPTKESLHELSLDYVCEDFVKRGILEVESTESPEAVSSEALYELGLDYIYEDFEKKGNLEAGEAESSEVVVAA